MTQNRRGPGAHVPPLPAAASHGRDLATLFITVPLFLFAVGGLIGLIGWLVGA